MGMLSNIFNNFRNIYTKDTIDTEDITKINPKFKEFQNLSKDEQLALRKSVINQYFKEGSDSPFQQIGYDVNSAYTDFIYGSVATNKIVRLQNYRRMAEFPEIGNAIEEICDEGLNYDDNGKIINLNIRDKSINEIIETQLQEEFEKYINLFNLDLNFYDFLRTLVIDGQLAWENIIDENNQDQGIIGINYIPTESYEFLIDDNANKKGIIVKNPDNLKGNSSSTTVQGNIQVQNVENYHEEKDKKEKLEKGEDLISIVAAEGVPIPWEQITYIDTGIYNPNKLIVYPILEKSRKAYRQLSLIEDSILIYRLVRAPSRYVFNIDTGKLPRSKAEQEVLKLMKRYQNKKFYNPTTGSVSNDYDPHQMMENFYFPKPEGSGGTTVENIDSGVNWTELPDLDYFLKKLYISLRVPFERFKDPNYKIDNGGESISADEYRFSKFVKRIQDRFSIGFTAGFITHLKLTGLWDQFELSTSDIKIEFTPPAAYDLYNQQRLLNIKFENYNTMLDNHEEISKELAMKKCLGWTDLEIKENNRKVEEETLKKAALERKVANISSSGNPHQLEGE